MHTSGMTEVLDRLFSAENERDWDAFRSLLHPQVEWTLIGPKTTVIRGRDAYMRRIEDAYTSAPEVRFAVHRSLRNEAGLIVTELLDNEGNVSVDVFDVRGGLVIREWEFLLGDSVQ